MNKPFLLVVVLPPPMHTRVRSHDVFAGMRERMHERIRSRTRVVPRAHTKPNTRKQLGSTILLYTRIHRHRHRHAHAYTEAGKQVASGTSHALSVTSGSSRPRLASWDEEAIQALSRAIRAGVTRGELGGEAQSSSSSLESTSDGVAEPSEGGEGGHACASGQQPSEVARD